MKKLVTTMLLLCFMLVFSASAFAAQTTEVRITTPYSDQQGFPSVFTSQPDISWYQYNPNQNVTFQSYNVIIYDELYNIVYEVYNVPQNTKANNKTHVLPKDILPKNQKLLVAVSVFDSTGEFNQPNNIHYMYIQG